MTTSHHPDLVPRLLKRAEEDAECADNSQVIVGALSRQMELFEARKGHNIYAVRMAVDHANSLKRDRQYAADLKAAAQAVEDRDALIIALDAMCAEFRAHDLPYGSAAYQQATGALNIVRMRT